MDFDEAIAAGFDAFARLELLASALAAAATDDQDASIAALAKRFATNTGPKGLARARDRRDVEQLALVQRGTKGVTADVSEALVDDVIERFVFLDLAFVVGGPVAGVAAGVPAALAPSDVLDKVREGFNSLRPPPAPQDLPLPAFVAGGAGLGALAAFTSSGNPRAAIAGAIGGAVLGGLAHYGLSKIGSFFTLK